MNGQKRVRAENARDRKAHGRAVAALVSPLLRDAERLARPIASSLAIDVNDSVGHERFVLYLHTEMDTRMMTIRAVSDRLDRLQKHVLEAPRASHVRAVAHVRDVLAMALRRMARWRHEDGCYPRSPSLVRCCGSSAHGWDAISRVYAMEAMLFDLIGRTRRKRQYDGVRLKHADVAALAHPRVNVLVCIDAPVHRWSAKMTTLQLRAIALRFNHLHGLPYNKRLRNALMKLARQCELRGYAAYYACGFHARLRRAPVEAGEGLLSGKFTGKITCTPQNNCGLSNVASPGKWCDRYVWSTARCASKVCNVLFWTNRMCRGTVRRFDALVRRAPSWKPLVARTETFSKSARDAATALLGAEQLQNQVIASMYPSIVGFDAPMRRDHSAQDTSREADIWSAANAIAYTSMRKHMNTHVRVSKEKFYLQAERRRTQPDWYSLCALHAFENSTRRNGRNAAGFMESFVIRIDEAQACFATLHELESARAPLIVKIGGSYYVTKLGTNCGVACDDACEAVVAWAHMMAEQRWRIGDIDFSSVYAPVLEQWCGGEQSAYDTDQETSSEKSAASDDS